MNLSQKSRPVGLPVLNAIGAPALSSNISGLIVSSLGLLCVLVGLRAGGIGVALGVVLFLVLVGVTVIYPERMLLATLAVSIFISVDISVKHDPFPRVGPTRILLAALYAGTLLNWWLKRSHDRISIRQIPLLRPILLYAAAVLLSAFMSIVPLQSYYAAFTDIVEQFFLFYLFVNYLRQPGFWDRVEKVLFRTTAVVCLFALAEEATKYSLYTRFVVTDEDVYRGGLLRVRATFFHPIALGCFIALIFPFVLSALIREPKGRKKAALITLLVVMLAASFLTVSRGPWIAILLEFGMFVAWWAWRNQRRIVTLAIVLACGISAFTLLRLNNGFASQFAPILNPNQFSLERTNEASSEYYRIALLNAVTDRLEGPRWIYGFGRGTFYLADVESHYDNADHVLGAGDSHYILLLLETGIAGLVAFIILALAALRLCAQQVMISAGQRRPLALASLAAVAGFIWNNITVSMFPILPLNLVFWISVAAAVANPYVRGSRLQIGPLSQLS